MKKKTTFTNNLRSRKGNPIDRIITNLKKEIKNKKMTTPIFKTKNKAVAICGFEDKDINEAVEKIGKLLKNHADNWLVLQFVLIEALKMKKGKSMGFDFGTKKEWQLKRIK